MPPETLAESGTITLGFNAYWWGESYQDALLAKAILPLFQQLIAECGLSRLWYDRATLRGPHIFALMTVPVELEKQAQALMLAALTKARNDQPSRYQISSQELQALHLDAGDKALCDADHEDGLAANNTFAIFVHRDADNRYPYFHWNAEEGGLFWRCVERLALFTLHQLADETESVLRNTVALHALVAFDNAFFEHGEEAQEYWNFHVKTLLPNLDVSRLTRGHAEEILAKTISPDVLAELRKWHTGPSVSESNGEFSRLRETFSHLRLVLGEVEGQARLVTRELLHVFLKQLGVPVLRQIPMIFALLALSGEVREHSVAG